MKSELKVDVKINLAVSRSTAEGCLAILEMYLNDNCGVKVEEEQREDGTMHFYLSPERRV